MKVKKAVSGGGPALVPNTRGSCMIEQYRMLHQACVHFSPKCCIRRGFSAFHIAGRRPGPWLYPRARAFPTRVWRAEPGTAISCDEL